jgi:hypothetical protein
MVVCSYIAAVETKLVAAAEGLANIAVVSCPELECTVAAAAEFEDIVVVGFVDIEPPLKTEHTATVVAAAVDMPPEVGHTLIVILIVLVAEVLG